MITSLPKPGAWYNGQETEFSVWAPRRKKLDLVLGTPEKSLHPMEKKAAGYWRASLSVAPGTRYGFRLDDGPPTLPDPASLSQPEGIRQKLDYLHELGINTIGLMPLAQFPGSRGWGYDGVYPYAIQHSYGGLAGFQRLVNAAYAIGMSVIVDVVYNHLGPEGNYLHEYGVYFTDKCNTPWGRALNYDDAWPDGVRTFFLQNARFWLEDVHVDALRLDAVHAIFDNSAIPFLQQLKEVATEIGARTGCKKELIVEMDLNAPRYINPIAKGGYGMDGQWADEFHHALRALLTGDTSGYYEDFGDITHLESASRNTYVCNNVYSPHRHRTFGGSADTNPYDQFVIFDQNHDHVGNRAGGNRLADVLGFEQLKLAAATLLRYYRYLIRFRQTRPALQGRTRDTMVVHPPAGLTLPIERKILTDQLFIWFHFGDQPVSPQNITWKYLGKVFDSADTQWRGPGAEAAAEVRPGEFLRIAPYSVVVYEKNN